MTLISSTATPMTPRVVDAAEGVAPVHSEAEQEDVRLRVAERPEPVKVLPAPYVKDLHVDQLVGNLLVSFEGVPIFEFSWPPLFNPSEVKCFILT